MNIELNGMKVDVDSLKDQLNEVGYELTPIPIPIPVKRTLNPRQTCDVSWGDDNVKLILDHIGYYDGEFTEKKVYTLTVHKNGVYIAEVHNLFSGVDGYLDILSRWFGYVSRM